MIEIKETDMFKKYDVIIANRRLSKSVIKGTIGTILLIVNKNPFLYEVEFVDENSDTLGIITVSNSDISLLCTAEDCCIQDCTASKNEDAENV